MTAQPSCLAALIETNVRWLRQALRLVGRLDDAACSTTPCGLAPHRAGAHLRNILEFYRCFLEGLKCSHIDYDARRRDDTIEYSRDAASAAIRSIIRTLETSREVYQERTIWIRMEDAEGKAVREGFMESSVSRELQVLSRAPFCAHRDHSTHARSGSRFRVWDGAIDAALPGIENGGGCVMCTVSWVQQPGGYHLLANRDEKRTRGSAFGPAIRECGGVRYVAPTDSEFGGTWIAANEFGVSVCLLNGDGGTRDSVPAPQRSRGLLLHELAWAYTGADCLLSLRQLDLTPYAPFVLLILEPDRAAILGEWNGERLTVDPAAAQLPLTSSWFDPCGVRRFRLGEFARRAGMALRVDPALLYAFHASHGAAADANADAYSPCMHREDAETVSFSWVVVTREEVRFLYSPSAPCRCSPCEQKLLARAA